MQSDVNSLSVSFARTLMGSYRDFHWHYDHSFVVRAIEQVGVEHGVREFVEYGRAYVDAFVGADGTIRTFDETEFNLDQINPGRNVFRAYRSTGGNAYRRALDILRGQLRRQPRTPSGGFWHKQIYPNQMWLDGLFMAGPFYAEFARAFDDRAAFDDIALQVRLLHDKARDQRTGLLYHAWDESRQQRWAHPETGCSPNFWGRGMGWFVMALVDILDDFPPAHPSRPALLATLEQALAAAARVQDPSGMWWQVLDQRGRERNYLESSCTAMFIYAMAKGVRLGHVPADPYLAVAQRAFAGLLRDKISTRENGDVVLDGICAVAGLGKYKADMDYRDGSYAYYVGERIAANDFKGAGAFLLASLEMERLG